MSVEYAVHKHLYVKRNTICCGCYTVRFEGEKRSESDK